jgi:hypothetical protein
MNRLQCALVIFLISSLSAAIATAQDADPRIEVDPLFPEFAHPRQDAFRAIETRDYRFINIDRHGKDVPGLEHYGRFIELYGTKFLKQRFLPPLSASRKFSYLLRSRAYAREYNETILHYLQQRQAGKR